MPRLGPLLGVPLRVDPEVLEHALVVFAAGLETDPPVVWAARAAAMTVDPIRSILAAQNPAGWWAKPGPGHGPKCRGTVCRLTHWRGRVLGGLRPAPPPAQPRPA